MVVKINRKIINQLLHQTQISPAREICGLIGSCNNTPTNCYFIDNIANNPAQRFLLDSQQHIIALELMRKRKEQLFAIYHSHPSSPPIPSATDIKLVAYPKALYLIISLNTKGVLELRGFQMTFNPPKEVMLTLTEN